MADAQCPTRRELSDYIVGKLAVARLEEIDSHLGGCSDCQQLLDTFSGPSDTLVSSLKRGPAAEEYVDEPECRQALSVVAGIAREPAFAAESGGNLEGDAQPELAQIGPYRLLAKLGQGGMGTVYKALHTKLKRTVALKVLSADRMRDAQAAARFEREMEAVGKLVHPNIVLAHDAGEFDETHFLAMEYLEGSSLSDLVKSQGALSIADACELVRQAAVGLQHVHQHGLVHRDIKPSNLMLVSASGGRQPADSVTHQPAHADRSPEPIVKILDLGLALLHHGPNGGHGELTSTGQVMGTLDYMAPEQGGDSHVVDIRADISSLRATLYKLLTSQPIYAGEKYSTPVQKITALALEPAPPIQSRRPDVADELATVVHRMLAKSPDERYATPAEVAEALAPFAAGANLGLLLSDDLPAEASPSTDEMPSTTTSLRQSAVQHDTSTALPDGMPKARDAFASQEVPTPEQTRTETLAGTLPRPKPRSWLPAAGVAVAVALVGVIALGIVFTIGMGKTKIEIELGAGVEAKDVKVVVKQDDQTIEVADAKEGWTIWLREGQYTLDLGDTSDTFQLDKQSIIVRRGKPEVVHITLKIHEGPDTAAKLTQTPTFSDSTSEVASQDADAAPVTIKPGQWVDVLRFVDPAIHTYTGSWHRDGDKLVVNKGEEDARILIPVEPKGSYQLRLSFVRTERAYADGSGGVGGLLPVGDARTMLVLDHGTIRANGLNLVNGHAVGHLDNPTTGLKRLIDDGVACEVEVTVRFDGDDVAITAQAGSQPFLDWSGPQSALSIADDWWEKGFSVPGLTVGRLASVEVQRLEIKMLDGEAKRMPLPLRRPLVCDPAPIKGLLGWTIVTARPRDELRAVAYSPDGKLVATCGQDGQIRLWEPQSRELVRVLGGSGSASELAWAPDGRHLAASGGRWLTVWDAESGRLAWRLLCRPSQGFSAVAWSPVGDILGFGLYHDQDHSIRLVDAKSGRQIRQLDGHTWPISSLAWSPDGKRLASSQSGEDGTIRLWNPMDGASVATLKTEGWWGNVVWAPDGQTLLSLPARIRHDRACLWEATTGDKLAEIPCGGDECVWLPDGSLIALNDGRKSGLAWQLYDVHKREVVGECAKLKGFPRVAGSPDGKNIAVVGADEFAIYDWANDRLDMVATIRSSTSRSLSVCWSPNGETLAVSDRVSDSTDDDAFVEVWCTSSDARRLPIANVTGSMVFSPDSQAIACTGGLRRVDTGGLVAQFPTRADQKAWSRDGRRLAIASGTDDFIGIWDVEK